MRRRSHNEEEAAVALTLLAIVLLVLLAWLAFEALKLVVTTVAAHPRNPPLRLAGVVALVTIALALAAGGRLAPLNALAGLALVGLVLTAWAVRTYYDALFQRSLTRERLVQDVLGPWW